MKGILFFSFSILTGVSHTVKATDWVRSVMFGATLTCLHDVGQYHIFWTWHFKIVVWKSTKFPLPKRLAKWRQRFAKKSNVLKNSDFCQKVQSLYISDHTILFKFCKHVVQIHIKKCIERLLTFSLSIYNGRSRHGRILMVNLPQIWLSRSGILVLFYVTNNNYH